MWGIARGIGALTILVGVARAELAPALVVVTAGTTKYDHGLSELPSAVRDAEALRAHFSTAMKADTIIRRNATRRQILEAWRHQLAKVAPNGAAIFHFSGHGLEFRGEAFLLARDADLARIDDTGIKLQDLLMVLAETQRTKAIIGVFIIDACREAAADVEDLRIKALLTREAFAAPPPPRLPPAELKEHFLMYAAGVGQFAIEGNNEVSVYTGELLKLLKGHASLPLAELAQLLRYNVFDEASTYRLADATHPHRQTPAYYDQLRQPRTITGATPEPGYTRPVSSPKARRRAADYVAGDIIKDCWQCPELVVVVDSSTRRKLAVGKFEVTQDEWNACVRDRVCNGSRRGSGRKPVSDVTWHDAQTYIGWLNRDPNRAGYRLPSTEEWSFAAGARPFAAPAEQCLHANGADARLGSLLLTDSAGCDDGVGREAAEAGRYRPNANGLHDMIGNVWEWTETAAPDGVRYILRGGSWRSPPSQIDPAATRAMHPTNTRSTIGLRVVIDVATLP